MMWSCRIRNTVLPYLQKTFRAYPVPTQRVICTYKEVESARRARYGVNFAQWRSPGEALLALDRITHVPTHTHQTQGILAVANAVGEKLTRWVSENYPDKTVRFVLLPIGSFPRDAKVLDAEEYDCLLVCEGTLKRQGIKAWFEQHKIQSVLSTICHNLQAYANKIVIEGRFINNAYSNFTTLLWVIDFLGVY